MLLVLVDGTPDADVLGFAHTLGAPVEAVAFSDENTADLPKLGVAKLHAVEAGDYAPETYGESLAQLIAQVQPTAVLAAANDRTNEILAHTAARAHLPLATNCVAATPGETWTLTRTRAGGMLLEDAELTADTALLTIAPGAPAAEIPSVDDCTVETFTPDLDPALTRTQVVERGARDTGVSLATAEVVVSGGRGVGSAEGYAVLEELAELLGGAVGCSRVATNNGWRPHSDQVGLTGTKIAPKLYVACGISGATQHWVGCMDSSAILAINTDPEAPMVTRATYAVLGDVHEVLPAVLAELRRRR